MRTRAVFAMFLIVGVLGSQSPALAQSSRDGPVAAVSSGFEVREEIFIRPGDVLQIRVWPDATLSGDFQVEETGNVYLPFLGSVRVAGVLLEELRDQLRRGYEESLKNPVVTVTPVYTVGVLGAVNRPGVYTATPTSSLFDVIAQAGGFSAAAEQDEVRIVRQNGVVEVDALRGLEEGLAVSDVMLQSGDQIVVPTRGGGFTWRSALEIFRTGATAALLIERLAR